MINTHRRRHTLGLIAIGASVALTLAACSSDKAKTTAETAVETAAETATPETAVAETAAADTAAVAAETTAAETTAAAIPATGAPLKVGVIAVLEGPFTVLGEDSVRGVNQAVAEFGGTVAGRTIELSVESSNASPDSAVAAARKLVEQKGVDVVVGPLSGDEGIAVKDYAKGHPEVTFLNGTSGAADTTAISPAPNFFRFSTDGAQWQAGLGEYAYSKKNFKKVVTIGEDYSFPYSQVAGFAIGYCRAGGDIAQRFWTPIGTPDFSSIVSGIPKDVDAIYVALGGADAINFLNAYTAVGGNKPIIGGSITVDQSVLSAKGALVDAVVGTVSAGPIADNNPDKAWTDFVSAYKTQFGAKGFPSPSLFAHGYYVNTKALLLGIKAVNGDLTDKQVGLQTALSSLSFDSPTGKVSIDKNRNGIADIFVTEVVKNADGTLSNKVVSVTPQVQENLGLSDAEYTAIGSFGKDKPACKK
jgi:branched-chain amino acid transport system substrate-binding protein